MSLTRTLSVAGCVLATATAVSITAGCASDNSQSMNNSSSMSQPKYSTNRFGGPVYRGKPALPVTVALVKAGGGPENFSLVTALNSMLGQQTTNAEIRKLVSQYGKTRVTQWVEGINFAVEDTLRIAKAKGVKLPQAADLSGKQLAQALVKAGTAPDNTFYAGYLFDHALSHPIHQQVMVDTENKYSYSYDGNYHAITNQAFYDVAHALGDTQVQLASYHK